MGYYASKSVDNKCQLLLFPLMASLKTIGAPTASASDSSMLLCCVVLPHWGEIIEEVSGGVKSNTCTCINVICDDKAKECTVFKAVCACWIASTCERTAWGPSAYLWQNAKISRPKINNDEIPIRIRILIIYLVLLIFEIEDGRSLFCVLPFESIAWNKFVLLLVEYWARKVFLDFA